MWVHYTNKNNYESILKEGFKFKSDFGRFGVAIYFMDNSDFGFFGDYKIEVTINTPILNLTHSQIREELFPELDLLEDEEGTPKLKNYVLEKGYKAVLIEYAEGERELAVYDLSAITILNK